jgi:hypothetical protein
MAGIWREFEQMNILHGKQYSASHTTIKKGKNTNGSAT